MRKVERQLRDRIKAMEAIIKQKDEDLEKYRRHFTGRFRWWIELLGKGQTPSLPWLIENDAKVLHGVKSWWWG